MAEEAQSLSDRLALMDLVARYAIGMDQADRDVFASIWTPDAVFECPLLGIDCHGLPAILDYFDGRPGTAPSAPADGSSLRISSTQTVQISGDLATGISEFIALRRSGDQFAIYSAGVYKDGFRRTGDGWRISSRVMDVSPIGQR